MKTPAHKTAAGLGRGCTGLGRGAAGQASDPSADSQKLPGFVTPGEVDLAHDVIQKSKCKAASELSSSVQSMRDTMGDFGKYF